MEWEVITNDRSSLQEYRLIDNHDCKVVIKYNPLHQSARMTSGNYHRLFFLESAGSLSDKTIFKNEYGMEVGNLVHDKLQPKEGTVVIEDKKYLYQIRNNSLQELAIYENNLQKRVATCTIPANKANPLHIFSASTQIMKNNCFLLGLCWYLFLPMLQEKIFEYPLAGLTNNSLTNM